MQRFKTTILLASILGILVVATVAATIVSNKKAEKKSEGGGSLLAVNIDDVNKIEIRKKGETQILVKTMGQWQVFGTTDVRANQTAISDLLNKAKEIQKDELVSENPEKQALYEADDANGIGVKFFKESEIISDFIIGAAGENSTTYVRAASDGNVYLTKSYIRNFFEKDDWRDLSIFKFDRDKISEITIDQTGKEAAILQKKDGVWKAEWYDKFEMDEEKVDNLLAVLSNLSGNDLVLDKGPAETGLVKPMMKVIVKFGDGSSETLNIGSKIEGDHYAKRSADSAIYKLPEFKVKELQKEKDDFAKEE